LDIVASAQPLVDFPLAAVLQSGRGRLALAWYHAVDNGWRAEGSPSVTNIDVLVQTIQSPVIVCGELTSEERLKVRKNKNAVLASPAACVRRPGVLAELAWLRWQAGKVDCTATLAPIYLHIVEPIAS
jgi:tRNA threonylcarbamoyladenosine biosynthesis protein TsaB